ncbi:hypothetical protein [Bacillus sp. FJAT-49736]|uniref:hypothetical protein n=1 Tax=Bacillus sp. FJAT-49736 TaxID=2833582 RepID=UPI001BC976B1|nr:hypothetical protein [Bacillus sp. FJAT-49736]MBS4172671.1 hypothetical protein [Bacillus sp. FJAT-49736]
MSEYTEIRGAHIHKLKNIDIPIPKGKWTVVSGSRKSSRIFDALNEEDKRP